MLDVASRYTELGEALLPLINPAVTTKYGMEITSFIVENVSVPPEVEQAIDKRASMGAVGNLNDFVKYQMAKGFESGGGGGAAGTAAELAVGFGLAQQMMQQGLAGGHATPTAAPAAVELLSPADAAQACSGVSEADVMAVLESGRPEGEEDRRQRGGSRARPSTRTWLPRRSDQALPRRWRRGRSPRSTSTPARPAARRPSGIRPSRSWSCPFCGTESPYHDRSHDGRRSSRLDLVAALRELPDERARLADRAAQRAVHQLQGGDGVRTRRGWASTASSAAPRRWWTTQAIKAPIRPQGVAAVPRRRVAGPRRHAPLVAQQVVRPGAAGHVALVDTLKSLYIPYWTFDAQAHCPWEAEAGHYYYVPVPGRDAKGRPIMRQERRVRWEPASGVVDHFFDDEPVPGTQGPAAGPAEGDRALPDPGRGAPTTRRSCPATSSSTTRWCWSRRPSGRRTRCTRALEAMCARQVPGDTYRNLRIRPSYDGRTFKHVLVPVWVLAYTYGGKPYQVVVNGVTGVIAGRYPYSIWKIGALAGPCPGRWRRPGALEPGVEESARSRPRPR